MVSSGVFIRLWKERKDKSTFSGITCLRDLCLFKNRLENDVVWDGIRRHHPQSPHPQARTWKFSLMRWRNTAINEAACVCHCCGLGCGRGVETPCAVLPPAPANAEGREQPLVELVEQESPISATLLRSQPAYFMAGGKRHWHCIWRVSSWKTGFLVPFLVFNYPHDFGQELNSLGILVF